MSTQLILTHNTQHNYDTTTPFTIIISITSTSVGSVHPQYQRISTLTMSTPLVFTNVSTHPQGSLLFPKIEFFIKADMRSWSFL